MVNKRPLIGIALALVAVLVASSMAWAAPSPQGALRAAFQAGVSGGGVIRFQVPNNQAVLSAAPVLGLDCRINPVPDADRELCAGTVYGVWVTWLLTAADREEGVPGLLSSEFDLDGVPLDVERASVHRLRLPFGPNDWYFSEGIPVLGTLSEGTHTLKWRAIYDGYMFEDKTIILVVEDCTTD